MEAVLRIADCELTEHSGHKSIDPQFFDPPEQVWARAYRTLRPFMACRTLYYEATAVFFREKHFILGSKRPRTALSLHSHLIFNEVPGTLLNLVVGLCLGPWVFMDNLPSPYSIFEMI